MDSFPGKHLSVRLKGVVLFIFSSPLSWFDLILYIFLDDV